MAGNGRGRSSGSNARLTGASISAAAAGGGSAGPMYSLRERVGKVLRGLSCFGSQKRGKRVVLPPAFSTEPPPRPWKRPSVSRPPLPQYSSDPNSISSCSSVLPSLLHPLFPPLHRPVPELLPLHICKFPRQPVVHHVRHRPLRPRNPAGLPPCFLHLHHRALHRSSDPAAGACPSDHPFLPRRPLRPVPLLRRRRRRLRLRRPPVHIPALPRKPFRQLPLAGDGTPGGGSSSSLYGQESPPTQSSRLFAAGSFSPSAESGIFFSASSAQFFLDQAAQLSYAHCHGGRRQSKACKQDAEELEAYRASFGFSADELTAAAQSYVEISDQADDCSSFTMSPFADAAAADKPCAEPWPTMERTSIFLRSHRPDSASPPFEPRGPKLRAQGRCRHYLTDEDEDEDEPHPKMWGTKGGGRGIYLSLSDAEVDYQNRRAGENSAASSYKAIAEPPSLLLVSYSKPRRPSLAC
ncbi:unnamed protein product [Spirodela intermedia]|uniref:Uncharacterized protein n=1 Tax=Spirodela intermedia TaxID=51605 RepID=A0A7I8JJS5_SPIIN|nr:unnamed protein product [Spirodela intermedia]CAA6670398.1 unnamed protein product [Spirodela intermedia]